LLLITPITALASQYFHCESQDKSVISILIKSYTVLEYETDWDVDGPYELTSYKAEMWTTFQSEDHTAVDLKIQGKMFNGKAGYLKQIYHFYNSATPYIKMFFCKPGKSNFFQGSED
jgi:hypothetical protein